ncbi:MAG: hypothetical protein NVV57_07975 [Demequina sp.]|jgi:hypothetical protein|nr:hypothetical protein [Demequina sp.]
MIVNVSKGTGWLRVLLSLASFGAVAWAVYALVGNHGSAYHNMSSQDPVYYYAILICLLVTFLAALIGMISGVAGVRSPGDAPGWVFNLVLVALLAATLWSAVVAFGYIAYLD